jgi:toxin HigB-1
VVVSYRDKRTRDFAAGKPVKAFSGFERPAGLKLDRMEAATSLGDLAALPGNRFEALRGDRKGQYSNGGFALNGLTARLDRLTLEIVDYR